MYGAKYKSPGARHERSRYIGTTTYEPGMVLARRDDYTNPSTDATREEIAYEVEIPSLDNAWRAAGVVAVGEKSRNSEGDVALVSLDSIARAVEIYTDQSITKGDLLGVHANTAYVRKGGCGGPLIGRALETVDGSSTPARLLADVGYGLPIAPEDRDSVVDFYDDFDSFTDGVLWDVTADAGATGGQAAANSILSFYADGDDNDEAYAESDRTLDLTQPFYFRAEAAVANLANGDSGYILGVSDDTGANILADNTGAIQANGDHAIFFKVEAGTVWQAETQTGSSSDADADVGTVDASYHVFEILREPSQITFRIDGTTVFSSTDTSDLPGGTGKAVFGAKSFDGTGEAVIQLKNVLVQGTPG